MPDKKERVHKLVDIFINYVMSPDLDAGWHAPSQLEISKNAANKRVSGKRVKQLTVAFSSSDERQGNDRSDDKMINEIWYLRNKHHDYKLAVMLLSRLPEKYSSAILTGPYLKAVYKQIHTDTQVAKELEIPVHQYRHNKKMAAKNMIDALTIIEEYEASKIGAA